MCGLTNGSYTVVPSHPDYNFNPTSKATTISGADRTGINFTATAKNYCIRGTISGGVAGITVSAGGKSGTTASNGTFAVCNLTNGSYTVVPSHPDYNFNPTSKATTISGADRTGINFTATAKTYCIRGTISGGVAGITVSAGGKSGTTASTGVFAVCGLTNGSYTVVPSHPDYNFNPTSKATTISGADRTGINFTATAKNYCIRGTISGGVAGITVSAGGKSGTTASNGTFAVCNLTNGSYTVVPSHPDYTFNPTSRAATISGADATGINFTATAKNYCIRGTISGGVAGITVSAGGKSGATASNGTFAVCNLTNGSYTVAPSHPDYYFTPTSRMATISGADATGINFSASLKIDSSKSVLPIVECVYDHKDGTYTAYFGVNNIYHSAIGAAPGSNTADEKNYISPAPALRDGQPNWFQPGRSKGCFSLHFDGSPLTWTLKPAGGVENSATASSNSPRCKEVEPQAKCIDPLGSDGFNATFGYRNDNDFAIALYTGVGNMFVPSPMDRGQPSSFLPGLVEAAFTSDSASGDNLSWVLGTKTATATKDTPRCDGVDDSCINVVTTNMKKELDDTALFLARATRDVARKLSSLVVLKSRSEREAQIARRDATRAIRKARKFKEEANALVMRFPEVVHSCPGESQCVLVDNQPTIDGLRGLYARQWSAVRRIQARYNFGLQGATKRNQPSVVKAKAALAKGRKALDEMPRFASDC